MAIPCNTLHPTQYLDKVIVTGIHSPRSLQGLPIPIRRDSRVHHRKTLEKLGYRNIVVEDPVAPKC
ncbi:hypothetical protein D1872_332120 [compost metagenome]